MKDAHDAHDSSLSASVTPCQTHSETDSTCWIVTTLPLLPYRIIVIYLVCLYSVRADGEADHEGGILHDGSS